RSSARRLSLLACLLGFHHASWVGAHDFWVQPREYWLSSSTQAAVTLLVGHGRERQRSPIDQKRILRFDAIAPTGMRIDLLSQLRLGDAGNDGEFPLPGSGTYVLALETDDRAESHLPAIRFNDYLKAEGLTPALEQRVRTRRMGTDGTENYSRWA